MTPKQKLIEKVIEIRTPIGADLEFIQWEKGYEAACKRFLKLIEEILP